ncbi:hypothetical protein [Dyella silvatica]|uniref:hypothetical protein n=1 Tax=Dyella silvatica TaxID=2992128 RepID=UPI00225BB819|nr:hypothetical protein [Dyella silvatica]
MMKQIVRSVYALALASAVVTPAIASESVAPGGGTYLTGAISLAVVNASSQQAEYSASCTFSAHANLNPLDATFTIDSVAFSQECGQAAGSGGVAGTVVAASLPWHGTTSAAQGGTPGPAARITGAEIMITGAGFGPVYFADCQGGMSNLYWTNGGSQLKTVTGVTWFPSMWDGLDRFGNTTSGRVCFADVSLYVSPFQTFTSQ